MTNFTVVYDACVLYPAPLRDFLMHLALTDMFRAKWSNEIHDEWINNVLKDRPDLNKKQLHRTRELMNANIRDCLVEGYQHLIPAIELPDSNDKHVLAAALHSSASVIVTYNLKDFPKKVLKQYGVEAQHPDEFISDLFDLDPGKVCWAAKNQRTTLKKPPLSVDQYLNILQKQSLVKMAAHLRNFSDLI